MPYIGKSPVNGGFHKLDALTASATATYALTLGGAAYYPETANQLLCSLNGVIQAPQDSFTVSGSNLVFDSALTASDSIDFVVALGDVLGVGSVTDGAITTAKIGNNAVTSAKLGNNAVTSAKLAATIAPTNLETTASTFKMTDLSNNAFYRTGTFTPVWSSSGATDVTQSVTTGTYGAQFGQYIRIGDLVTFTGYLQSPSSWSYTNGGAISQQLYIYGLPFKGASSNGGAEQWGSTVNYISNIDWGAGISMQGMVRNDEKFIRLFYMSTTTSGNVTTSHVDQASSFIYFSGSYRTEEA